MVKHPLSYFIILLTLFEVFVKTHLTVHDSNHDFVSNNYERYFVGDISTLHEELSAVRGSAMNELNMKLLLKFEPEFLDFQQRPLGVPHLEKVTLFNVDSNRSIDMTSISGSTVHFHSSFFEDKRIPPLGNTSFNVVFLGREEGAIESNLFIHTTEGHFKYQVKGASVSSPYRLRPIVGIKLPLNTTFSPLIKMYNPYTEPIQIVEIYSSGGDFHLELPSGELEGPKNMWEIPPLQSKAVIRVRFNARTEQNHTAYVRIKLNNTEDILVVPLEVEVTSTAGLYAPQGSVDFGVGGSLDMPKQVELFVHNPLKKAVRIHSVSSASKAIKIEYENVKIPSDLRNSKGVSTATKIATLTLDWKAAHENKEFSGKIIVKYKNGKSKTEIPYYLTVLEGGLLFNSSITTYFINESSKQMIPRNVVVKNNFLTPLAVTNVSLPLEAQNFFNILNFKPIILKPQEEKTVFMLNLKTDAAMSNLKLNSFILLKTNISTVELPLLSYNGKLQVNFPYKSKDNSLDLGLISVNTKKDTHFLVLNTNPVTVNLNKITASIPTSSIEIVGCSKGNYSTALLFDLTKNMTKCESLTSDEFAIIRLSIQSPHVEAQVWGEVVVETQYEQLSIPVHYKVAQGKLEIGPDRLVFDQCFPGKICSHPLRVHSTFNDPMVIENIMSIPPDPRLSSKHLGHIMARSTKVIGHLYLDPSLGCLNECYSGLNSDDTSRWLQTLTLPNSTPEFDLNLVKLLYNRYLNETSNGMKRWQNLTMRLDTSKVKWHIFKTRVKMSWPSLVVNDNSGNETIFKFPLTQVGNVSYHNITVRNPSSHNLIVQLVLNPNYPGSDVLNDGLPSNFIPPHLRYEPFRPSRAFFFHKNHNNYNDVFRNQMHVDAHHATLPVLLSPGENFTFTVGFRAKDSTLNSAFLYIRNNLTVLEVIRLNGQGAVPKFTFANLQPGSAQPLSFQLTEKNLTDCKDKKHLSPNFTLRRTFIAHNSGNITIFISGFFISGLPCEGYGFKVVDCKPFSLVRGTSRKIDILFTPDFTLAKIIRTLSIETSLNIPVNYTLITTLPPSYLLPCSMALTRPAWEPYLYYMMLSSMCVLLIFVVAMIIIEAEHTLKEAAVFVSKASPTTQPPLDLRLIGAQTRNEIRSPKSEENSNKEKKRVESKGNENDIINLMDDSGKSPKHEGEKYTALIPTTGKSKKKFSKKSSNDINSNDHSNEIHKKCCDIQKQKSKCVDKNVNTENDSVHVTKKSNESIKERKSLHAKRSSAKNDIAVFEEETSSTTTESSNNEEADKDSDKIVKTQGKKSPVITKICTPFISKPNNTSENCKDVLTKFDFKKSSRKIAQKIKEKDEHKADVKTVTEHKIKGNKTVKERKDKQPLAKKLSAEKKSADQTNNNTVRVSPTMQFNSIWGENRASFSDVVARNDNTPTNTVRPPLMQNQNQSNKPTMYVEPYKQTTTDLGPIGSRKADFQQENHGHNLQDPFSLLSSSFFSDHNLNMDNSSGLLNFGDNWESHSTASQLMSLMQPNISCSGTPNSGKFINYKWRIGL
ncbi:hypothetical protein ILUMI_03793 [Ignelater luminosus]|uniref:Transmembrane protein 131 n=1 Tax=Ignelater luminosus TaxID=2038154 RepID=A0A8K0DE06_IGNLU|nr:hypothetical protein ILUMI_03793 [Ignelater luminosus]